MNLRLDLRILGMLAALMGVFLLVPLFAAVIRGESPAPFLAGIACAALLGVVGLALGRGDRGRALRPRDGFFVVTAGWLAASAVAAVPYLAGGGIGPVDAWFEAVSGITTTGSTILKDIEALDGSLLLWRSMTQWLGGMGIILFTIAVLPLLGIGGMQLFRAEVPGPVADKIAPRLAVTARYLWLIYVGLTGLEAALLWLSGLTPFDAVNHALTTMATGGFSTRNASIAAFESPFTRAVVIVFMLLAGINFVLHFKAIHGRFREVSRDEELRWYLALAAIFVVPIFVTLTVRGQAAGAAFEDALFTVVSLMTTTGYTTVDYEAWPAAMMGPVVLLLVLGGMAGSTGGGIKTLRTLLAFRSLRSSFARMLYPHAVHPVTYRGAPVNEGIIGAIWGFFAAYILLAIAGMLVVNSTGADLVTSWTASLTAIGNVGPGLGRVGPAESFAFLPGHVKIVLSFLMLAGRLEIYTVLMVALPGFWRR